MALNYGENYVQTIKKNNVEYLVRDSIAEAAINVIQGDAATVGSIAKAQADAQSYADSLASNYDAAGSAISAETAAKTYAKDLVDKVLGSDSAAETLSTLQNVLNELNDPSNQDGITGTFIDTVKAGLANLGNKTNAVYNFTLYDSTGETKWGEGTAEVIELRSDGATIKVLTNDSDQSFVGRTFNVNTLDETALIPLFSTEGLAQNISVRVSLKDKAVPNTVKDYVDDAISAIGASSIEDGVLTLAL